ncbi:MAG TPA: argininosuccinate lyase, partial [Planctomycetaceae bacterium]|nr:argininosuccinate lyase [Planctomycetaceae bacterium]
MASPSRSGVFDSAADKRVEQFTESVSFDQRLYAHDIQGSIAHANMLADVGVLTGDEAASIEATLLEIKQTIDDGEFATSISLE